MRRHSLWKNTIFQIFVIYLTPFAWQIIIIACDPDTHDSRAFGKRGKVFLLAKYGIQ